MISRNIYKLAAVLMALVTAFTVTGLSGCKSRTVSNEVTTEEAEKIASVGDAVEAIKNALN